MKPWQIDAIVILLLITIAIMRYYYITQPELTIKEIIAQVECEKAGLYFCWLNLK